MKNVRDYNNIAEWLEDIFVEHGYTSSRQASQRINVAHTTLEDIRRRRQPNVPTVIKLANAYDEDIASLLALAGHVDIAEIMENQKTKTNRGATATYIPPLRELQSGYHIDAEGNQTPLTEETARELNENISRLFQLMNQQPVAPNEK